MRRLLPLLLLCSLSSFAKNVDTTGAQSVLSLTLKTSKYSAVNFYHYDVFSFEKKSLGSREYEAGHILTYFQTAYSYDWLPTVNLSVGHIYQRTYPFREEFQNENRIFEQVTLSSRQESFTSTHRFRLEERFVDVEGSTEFRTRLRYQVGAKVPLRGLTLDPGELYVNTYNEFYFSTTGKRNALFSDDWLFLGVGTTTKNLGSFELGPLVQWSRANEDKDTRTHYTVQFAWLVKI